MSHCWNDLQVSPRPKRQWCSTATSTYFCSENIKWLPRTALFPDFIFSFRGKLDFYMFQLSGWETKVIIALNMTEINHHFISLRAWWLRHVTGNDLYSVIALLINVKWNPPSVTNTHLSCLVALLLVQSGVALSILESGIYPPQKKENSMKAFCPHTHKLPSLSSEKLHKQRKVQSRNILQIPKERPLSVCLLFTWKTLTVFDLHEYMSNLLIFDFVINRLNKHNALGSKPSNKCTAIMTKANSPADLPSFSSTSLGTALSHFKPAQLLVSSLSLESHFESSNSILKQFSFPFAWAQRKHL